LTIASRSARQDQSPQGGTLVAMRARMAAVLCLILIPILASVGFMTRAIVGDSSPGGMLALLTFILLAGGIVFGALGMARGWDGEA
jgi:hypothetical protein